ncbi:uncharacterized protein LOC126253103 [Schistocerca nitens]|uniref:uncharacterized protein LOC126253103 n=1 Tax=Schistocerca nitens TaxID=7011 RepID=UPI002118B745|nr:uncharacterized protein LOC126253103 [Schistocerca nitens]XP_049860711.1 uncharacterized protein LOC126354815 [Schistocerca gregaria]
MKHVTSLLLLALLLPALHSVDSREAHHLERAKRQTPNGNRAQLIDNIFQIPIQTLTAVNNLVRNTQPLIQRRRSSRGQRQALGQRPSTPPQFSPDATRGARVAQLYTAADGSSFKI